tara:strand:+ start:120 stop:1145 length:1026 start_codon:yes stop_codon:yes gene_type:complete
MKGKIIVTGAAGFIGFHLCKRLITDGFYVIGIDNLNSYYDLELKKARLNEIKKTLNSGKQRWIFIQADIENKEKIDEIFKEYRPNAVVHLAAQAGVRYSLENPITYLNSNLLGFGIILESCRQYSIKNLLYASSSSVYGGNTKTPFSEEDTVNHPVSLYAATKKANELMAHSYSHLYKISCTGMRFFTVYGPWGRPDMAPILFTKSILDKKPIQIFNYGKISRDFTYIDDAIESIMRLLKKPSCPDLNFNKSKPNPSSSWAPYMIINIGNSNSIPVLDFVNLLEKELGIEAIKEFIPMQPGDVKSTSANTDKLESWISFKPSTNIEIGIKNFVKWYLNYYH